MRFLRRHLSASALLLAAAVSGCASSGGRFHKPAQSGAIAEPAALADIESTALLIGDAGEPGKSTGGGNEPVLQALRTLASAAPERTVIVYLGDNIYPAGMPPDDSGDARRRTERIIDRQVDTLIPRGVRRIFVPGNHDWNDQGARWHSHGIARITEQGKYLDTLRARRGVDVALYPPPGCPGPAVLDVGPQLRIIAVDTEWWLQREFEKKSPASCNVAGMPADSASSVAALRAALEGAGARHTVVVAHHPMVSGGSHGGYCPGAFSGCGLKNLWAKLRRSPAASWQDVPHPANVRMRAALGGAMASHPPLLFASGHDHDLQVIAADSADASGTVARFFAVSGTGIFGHTSAVACLPSSRFAAAEAGLMRLDVLRDGRAALTVLTVTADGVPRPRARFWLTDGTPAARCS